MLVFIVINFILLSLSQISRGEDIIWELEDYNDWNLPFAKTVEIKSKVGIRH